jgi:carbon storage regulator
MLVLTRKAGEDVVIDSKIRVTIVAVSGHTVRLGFEAPEEVLIFRDELENQRHGLEMSPARCPRSANRGNGCR